MNITEAGTSALRHLFAILAVVTTVWPVPSTAGEANDTARMIGGMSSDPLMREYSHDVAGAWSQYEKRFALPMRKWACTELGRSASDTVFYPFSGPDLPTVMDLFPDAQRYVLVSIQKAEAPPPLQALSPTALVQYLATVRKAWTFFGTSGFFKSDDLDAVEKVQGEGTGVTGPLMGFAARLGFEVEAVERLSLGLETGNLIVDNPAVPESWDSVRLTLRKAGRTKIVDYVRLDLSDGWLRQVPGHRKWIDLIAANPTLLKAASHHLQEPDFTVIRDSILRNAPLIVQDETGLDYDALAGAFTVRLYGQFTRPHKSFDQRFQRPLVDAYRTSRTAKPLPFRLGYEKNSGSAVQIAYRGSESPGLPGQCGIPPKTTQPPPVKRRRAD